MPPRLLLLAFPFCAACPGPGDSGWDVTPTLNVKGLSTDEIAVQVSLPGDGTLVCGSQSRDVPGGLGTFYVAGFQPGSIVTCQATGEGGESDPVQVQLPPPASPGRVLFDAAHGETSGNADWIVDNNAPEPSPADPDDAEDWRGGYSSFGFGLHSLGFEVKTLEDRITSGDLSGAQALVIPEPNNRFEDSEIQAIAAFVQGGGGLVLISNHNDSDRDSDGVDAPQALDPLLEELDAGIQTGDSNWDAGMEQNTTAIDGDDHDPVLHGMGGDVVRVDFFELTSFRIDGLPTARQVVGIPGQAQGYVSVRVAAGHAGEGRVLCIPDSAAADDGTGSSGDELQDGWTQADNGALFLNATAWAAGVR